LSKTTKFKSKETNSMSKSMSSSGTCFQAAYVNASSFEKCYMSSILSQSDHSQAESVMSSDIGNMWLNAFKKSHSCQPATIHSHHPVDPVGSSPFYENIMDLGQLCCLKMNAPKLYDMASCVASCSAKDNTGSSSCVDLCHAVYEQCEQDASPTCFPIQYQNASAFQQCLTPPSSFMEEVTGSANGVTSGKQLTKEIFGMMNFGCSRVHDRNFQPRVSWQQNMPHCCQLMSDMNSCLDSCSAKDNTRGSSAKDNTRGSSCVELCYAARKLSNELPVCNEIDPNRVATDARASKSTSKSLSSSDTCFPTGTAAATSFKKCYESLYEYNGGQSDSWYEYNGGQSDSWYGALDTCINRPIMGRVMPCCEAMMGEFGGEGVETGAYDDGEESRRLRLNQNQAKK